MGWFHFPSTAVQTIDLADGWQEQGRAAAHSSVRAAAAASTACVCPTAGELLLGFPLSSGDGSQAVLGERKGMGSALPWVPGWGWGLNPPACSSGRC